jgi:outer membrane receptor for ferrienterochelin and colicins
MIDSNTLIKIRIAVLVPALVMGMLGTGVSGSWPSDADRTIQYQTGANDWSLERADAQGDPQQLALNGAGEEDRRQLQELLAVLDEETDVATRTKMNSDYVPGMVTVLHGEKLEALGVHTVIEALAMVPGIQASRLPTGEPTVKVRGFAYPFNAGNVKIMLNSIALSRESSGINSSVLLTPLAQVDRIEVIRGPGSSLYGDFAMAGVVNIITRNTGGRLFGLAGDDDSRGGGGHYSYRDEVRDFGLGLNISAMDGGKGAASLMRYPDEERHTGVFNFNYKTFSFTAEGVRRQADFARLQSAVSPPPPPGGGRLPPSREEESWAMEGRQTIVLGSNVTLDAHLSYLKNSYDAHEPLTVFKGDRVEAGGELNWSPWDGHQVLLSVLYADSDIDEASQQGAPGSGTFQVAGIDRKNYSLGLQDQVALNERLSVTLGVRYDDYDDVGSLLTPRIAALYRLGEHHLVKAQYSQGFRSPTFWELYASGSADESLDFEVMKTTELSYIYRRAKSVARVTLYYSEIDDGIYGKSGGGSGNIVDIDAKGAEVEWEQQISEKLRWQANLSYNDTWDGRSTASGHEAIGVAAWLGNLAFFVQPAAKLMLTGRLQHTGDRYSSDGKIDGYDTIDLTVSRADLWKDGVTLRIGVKNILDDKIVYMTDLPLSLQAEEFSGRTWWLQVSYDF